MISYTLKSDTFELIPVSSENIGEITPLLLNNHSTKSSLIYSAPFNLQLSTDELSHSVFGPSFSTANKLYYTVDSGTGELKGIAGFSRIDCIQGRADLIYIFPELLLKEKYISGPLKILLNQAVLEWNIRKISALAYADDLKTGTVLKSMGFEKEGLLKEHVRIKNEYMDVQQFCLFKNNYHPLSY